MHKVLFKLGSFEIPSFGVMVMVGFLAGLWLARKRAPRFGFTQDQITDAAFWTLIAGILGARIGFILQEIPYYLQHPRDLLSLRFEGLTSFGGIALAVGTLFYRSRKLGAPALRLMDAVAPSFLIGNAFGRVGCLLNGCCYGGRCDLPWGIHVAEFPGLHHPAQVYDGLMNLAALALFLLVWDKRPLKLGQATGFVLVGYGLSRFIYEFWRAGSTSTTIGSLPITEGHVAALLVLALGVALYAMGARRETSEAPVREALA